MTTSKEGSIEAVVETAVRAQVSQMIVQGLEGVDGLVARIIAGALQEKVRDQNTYKDIPFIQLLAQRVVREAAHEALQSWVEDNKPTIRAEVERQLVANKKAVAQQLVLSLAGAVDAGYRLDVSFTAESR